MRVLVVGAGAIGGYFGGRLLFDECGAIATVEGFPPRAEFLERARPMFTDDRTRIKLAILFAKAQMGWTVANRHQQVDRCGGGAAEPR